MTVSTSDSQALDLLSAPSALSVRLTRNADFAPTILSSSVLKVTSPWQAPPELVAEATWWSALDSDRSSEKTLHGEIRIPENVSPSCLILNFLLQARPSFSWLL